MDNFICHSQKFYKAMEYLFAVEGGYSNHKLDKGGVTNFGITQKTYNLYLKKHGFKEKSVTTITKNEVFQIYYEEFWLPSGAEKIDDFDISLILFDSCVNHGLSIGKALYKKSGNNAGSFLNLRREKYKAIVAANPLQKVFLKGWMNRIDRLEKFIDEQKVKYSESH